MAVRSRSRGSGLANGSNGRHHGIVTTTATPQREGQANGRVVHDDPATRATRGREARKRLHRTGIGEWAPASDRPDPTGLLRAQEETRVPELIAIRHQRMLVSPFTFYRGAAVIMAADLGSGANTGLTVQLLRRRPPRQLRGVRLSRALARLRHQRLRRDEPRPVRVGRAAPGGELRDRRSRE